MIGQFNIVPKDVKILNIYSLSRSQGLFWNFTSPVQCYDMILTTILPGAWESQIKKNGFQRETGKLQTVPNTWEVYNNDIWGVKITLD